MAKNFDPGTEERNKRKQAINLHKQQIQQIEIQGDVIDENKHEENKEEIKDKSLTECVMEDDALNVKTLLVPLQGEPTEESIQAALLSARNQFLNTEFTTYRLNFKSKTESKCREL